MSDKLKYSPGFFEAYILQNINIAVLFGRQFVIGIFGVLISYLDFRLLCIEFFMIKCCIIEEGRSMSLDAILVRLVINIVQRILFHNIRCELLILTSMNLVFKALAKFSTNKLPLYKRLIPDQYLPYYYLGRYDKPIGFMLLYWPCAWGLSIVSPVPPLFDYGLFLFGSITLRAAGCIINDIADKQFDKDVERTKQRPLATGLLTTKQAMALMVPNLICGLLVLTQLPMNGIISSFAILPIVCIYPLMKRYFNYPQLFLGLAFNWGVIVAYLSRSAAVQPSAMIPMYIAGICWTLIYDTIYAYQDIKDDERIGVKSTAITWKSNYKIIFDRLILASFCCMCFSAMSAGLSSDCGIGLLICHLLFRRKVVNINIEDREQCGKMFRNSTYFGMGVTLSLILGGYLKMYEEQQLEKI